jgi:cellobiose phosphorylase
MLVLRKLSSVKFAILMMESKILVRNLSFFEYILWLLLIIESQTAALDFPRTYQR